MRTLTEIEIFRAANQLLQQHGEDAQHEAARPADAMLERSDFASQRVWKRVLAVIDKSWRREPGAAVH